MTDAPAPPRPDTSDMIAVHQVFRDAFGDAPRLIGGAPTDDPARVGKVSGYYAEVLDLLELHHEGEDALIWPKLLERSPGDAETVTRIADQHHGVYDDLGASRSALAAWRAGPSGESAAALVAALADLDSHLAAHLDEEEKTILPLCAAHLTMPEWGELPAHAMGHYKGERPWLILGLVREHMTQAQRDDMLAHMPPPAVSMWHDFGERASSELMADIRNG